MLIRAKRLGRTTFKNGPCGIQINLKYILENLISKQYRMDNTLKY